MVDNKRQHKRVKKTIYMHYTISGAISQKWDMSVIEDISTGGIKFSASDLGLKDKIILLRIKIPDLAPNLLELEARVLDIHGAVVRAKFVNLSEHNKNQLAIVEKMIEREDGRRFPH